MSGSKSRRFYHSINFTMQQVTLNDSLGKWETVIRCKLCGTSQTIRNFNKGAIEKKANSWRDTHICHTVTEAASLEMATSD